MSKTSVAKQLDLVDYVQDHTIAPNIIEHRPTDIIFNDPSLAQQNFAGECDINNILDNWERNNVLTHLNQMEGQYADLPETSDYQTAMNTVISAQNMFAELPSKIRDRFANDPEKFMQFMHDPKNFDEAVSLGLLTPRTEAPTSVGAPPSSSADRPPAGAAGGELPDAPRPPQSKNKASEA